MIGKSVKELAELPIIDPWQLMGAWLSDRCLAMLHAYRGVGKTFFALALADALATGKSFLRWQAEVPSRVIYFDGEMGYQAIRTRMQAVNPHFSSTNEKHLRFVTFEDCAGEIIWNLASDDGQRRYSAEVRDFDVVILDNLCTCARAVKRESDVEVWERVRPWLVRQRSEGRSVLIIHHSGKSGLQLGTSIREQVLNTVLNLRKPSIENANPAFELYFEKTRDFWGSETSPLFVEFKDGQQGIEWDWRYLSDKKKQQAQLLHDRKWTVQSIATALNLPYAEVKEYVGQKTNYAAQARMGEDPKDSEDDDIF